MRKTTSKLHLKRNLRSLLMVGLLTLPAMGNAAPTLVQDSPTGMYVLQSNGSTIKEVLGYIEKTGKYVFVYDQNVKNRLSESVDITVKGKSIDSLLSELCNKTGLKYKISGKQVTISNAAGATRAAQETVKPKSKTTKK